MLPFFLNEWENETMPPAGKPYRNGQLVELSAMAYEYQTSAEYTGSIQTLYDSRDELDPVLRHETERGKLEAENWQKYPSRNILHIVTPCWRPILHC